MSIPTWPAIRRAFDEILADLSKTVATEMLFVAATTPSTFTIVRSLVRDKDSVGEGETIPLEDVYCQAVVQGRESLVIPDTQQSAWRFHVREAGVRAYLGIPIFDGSGTLYGTVCATHNSPYPYSELEIRLMEQAARMIGLLIDIEQLALRDALTGVYNRGFLEHHLQHGVVPLGDTWGLLYLDFDDFKLINDRWGHDCGDVILRQMARRICETVASRGHVVRLGGDEFVVVVPHLNVGGAREELTRLATDILAQGQFPIAIMGHELKTSLSMGLATYPQDGSTFDGVLREADKALYQAKERGRAQICTAS